MLGGLFALLAAFTFAVNNATTRRGVLHASVSQAMAITVPMGVPLFLIVAWPVGALPLLGSFSPMAILYLSLAGISHFVWGRYCNYRATKAMGSNLVAPVQQWSLVFTLGAAVLFLGEVVTPLRLVGIALVLLGPMLTATGEGSIARIFSKQQPAKPAPERANAWQPNLVEGYTFALLSSTGYGASPILVSLGLESRGLGVSLAAGLISYIAATVATFLMLALWPGQLRHAAMVTPVAARWFALGGLTVWASQTFRYLALSVAPVSVVTPIQRLSIVFRVHLSRLINPEHEVFGAEIWIGTLVSLLGVLALSVSTDLVLSLVPLPDWVVAAARWHWP